MPPVLNDATVNFHFEDGTSDISIAHVLDTATLRNIRECIERTFLPTWMERPPRNFGSISHGKLKADQWRVVCSVHLLIALVPLWGASEQQERELLRNFVHLVTAVELATRRSVTKPQIQNYYEEMYRYLRGLRKLFDHKLVSNHHLSLHLPECLESFGPVHGWWSFPFERYNGVLGRMNTNNHICE